MTKQLIGPAGANTALATSMAMMTSAARMQEDGQIDHGNQVMRDADMNGVFTPGEPLNHGATHLARMNGTGDEIETDMGIAKLNRAGSFDIGRMMTSALAFISGIVEAAKHAFTPQTRLVAGASWS